MAVSAVGSARRLDAELLVEQIGDAFLGQVHSRHDDVRGHLARQLHDVFAQVGFQRLNARLFQRVVKVDLFACHALGFDHALDVVFPRDRQHNRSGFGGIARPMDVSSGTRHLLFELRQIMIEMIDRLQANLVSGLPQHFPVIRAVQIDQPGAVAQKLRRRLLYRRRHLRRNMLHVGAKVDVGGGVSHSRLETVLRVV